MKTIIGFVVFFVAFIFFAAAVSTGLRDTAKPKAVPKAVVTDDSPCPCTICHPTGHVCGAKHCIRRDRLNVKHDL